MHLKIQGSSLLVTGGSGFIGTHLLKSLLEGGAEQVRVIDQMEPQVKGPKLSWVGKDLSASVLMDAASNVSGIFHMAVLPLRDTSDNPALAIQVNLGGTHNIIQAAKENGCKIVFSSASSVYGETEQVMDEDLPFKPTTFYGASKAASELWLMAGLSEWKVPFVALRYMNVYGPGQRAGLIPFQIGRIKAGQPPKIEGDGSAEFDFVYVADVVQANLLAMTSEVSGSAFNVGSGEKATVRQVCDRLQQLAGTNLDPEFVPERPGAVKRRVGSSAKAEEILGYRPITRLEDGLRMTWEASQ